MMKIQSILLVVALFALPVESALKVDFSASSQKNAVAKVIGLLNEMKTQIEGEAAEDADMFEKLGCWCTTNKEEKTAAVDASQQHITDLVAAIPEAAAKAATLEVEIKQLNKEVDANTKALEEATGIRAKEQDEYRTNEKDMISSTASLKSAIGVMSKVAAGAALPQESLAQVQAVLQRHIHKPHMSFLQGPATIMLQQNAKGKNRAPSSAIFGILKGMKESFEQNLESAKTEEELAIQQFAELKKAKTSEVAAAKDLIDTKTVELAKAKEINAHGKEDLADTRALLSADNEFLSNLNLKCDNAEKEYNDRVKVRNEETVAVAETIAILNDDDAKDQFNKAGLGTFVQVSSKSSKKEQAAQMLSKVGKQLHKPALISLSMSMRLHGFEEVIANIDNMKKALKAEQAEEVKQKDYCVTEFNENDKNVAEKSTQKTDLETSIADESTEIETLTEEIAALDAQIAETNKEMLRASQLREGANHEFQVTIQDQRATQAILQKALDRLKSFYDAKAAALLQAGQEPPAQGTYKKNSGSSGVMAMIETLVEESAQLEADAMKGEADSQAAYESFMKDSTAANEASAKDVTNKTQRKAQADADRIQASNDLSATVGDLLTLGEYSQELHKKCDFLVKNFDLRQQSRTQEMEALAQAKAIFQGAK